MHTTVITNENNKLLKQKMFISFQMLMEKTSKKEESKRQSVNGLNSMKNVLLKTKKNVGEMIMLFLF